MTFDIIFPLSLALVSNLVVFILFFAYFQERVSSVIVMNKELENKLELHCIRHAPRIKARFITVTEQYNEIIEAPEEDLK